MRKKGPIPAVYEIPEILNPIALKLVAELTDSEVSLIERIALLNQSLEWQLTEAPPSAQDARDAIALLLHTLDISRARQIELERLSLHDVLTGLKNRRYYEMCVALFTGNRIALRGEYAILFIDIDHFKEINDAQGSGHHIGDKVLIEVAHRVAAVIRDTDEEVIRLGGEEFLVLLPNTDPSEAMEIAERTRKAVKARPVEGFPVTVSIGVALGGSSDLVNDTMKRAGIAMHQAKRKGRDQVAIFERRRKKKLVFE